MRTSAGRAPGILLLYAHEGFPYASTVLEHVNAFPRHAGVPVTCVNTTLGFPRAMWMLRFDVVVLHYSIFGTVPYALPEPFVDYVLGFDAYRVGFFQDEYRFCPQRFQVIKDLELDCVYTLVEPQYFDQTYRAFTGVPRIVHTLPGYVGAELLAAARIHARPDEHRPVDVAYRARDVPFYLGRAAREKPQIGRGFAAAARDSGLNLDISVEYADRLYGIRWWRSLGGARAVLGVEGGASVFDLTGEAYAEYERVMAEHPGISFEAYVSRAPVLRSLEYTIPYLMITPRHFESAAFGCAQVLFEGSYSGVLAPDVHYIPLKKDFSNVDEVIERVRDRDERRRVAVAARRDLVESGRFSYERLIGGFEELLVEEGALRPPARPAPQLALARIRAAQRAGAYGRWLRRTGRAAGSRAKGLARRLSAGARAVEAER